MKRILLFQNWLNENRLNELKFTDVEDFKAYSQKHKMRPNTEVTIGNKKMKVSDVEKKETKEEKEEINFKGLSGHYSHKDELNAKSWSLQYKKNFYEYNQADGWRQFWPSMASKERLLNNEVPVAKVMQEVSKMDPKAPDKILVQLGLKEKDPEVARREAEIAKQVSDFDEKTKYPEIEVDEKTTAQFKQIDKDKDLKEFLGYLVHSKDHVFNNTEDVPEMQKVFDIVKDSEYNKPLYRGMYKVNADDFKVGQEATFGRYQSFSEDPKVAKSFADPEPGKTVVLKLNRAKGAFNYGAYISKKVKGYVGNVARYEREHIIDRNQKYKVTKIEKEGPFTIVNIELI